MTTHTDPIAAARAMRNRIRAVAAEIEQTQRLPAGLVQELRDGGFFSLLVPATIGGGGVDPITAARVVEELAHADGSVGWCVMLAMQSGGFEAFLPESTAREIWGGHGIVCGTARPIGRAVATSSPAPGFVVSGRWPFASGSSHADWFMGECIVYDGEQPRRDAQGHEVSRAVMMPRSAVTVYPTWQTTGLGGTASNDFSVEGAFVPETHCFQMLITPPRELTPLNQAPALVFMNHGAHALGVARSALDAGREAIATKIGWGGVPLRDQPRFQTVLAEATALVEAASAYLYGAAEDLWATVNGRDPHAASTAAPLRARLRLAASHAARSSVQAVDLLHGALATSAIFTQSPLDRPFRDIHTAAAHVMIGPLTFEAAGRVALGIESGFPFF